MATASCIGLEGGAETGAVGGSFLFAGGYAGKWSGSDGNAGEVRLSLKDPGNGAWDANVEIFTQGDTIFTTLDSIEVGETKIELVYHFEAEGTKSKVKMTGQLDGDVLAGDYQVFSIKKQKVTATGMWIATRVP